MLSGLVSTWSPPPHPYNRSNTRSTAHKYATAGGKPSFLRVVVAACGSGLLLCMAVDALEYVRPCAGTDIAGLLRGQAVVGLEHGVSPRCHRRRAAPCTRRGRDV